MATALTLWTLLTRWQRWTALGLLGLMLVGTVLEMLSIGLILPMLAIVAGNSRLPWALPAPWLERLGDPGSPRLLLDALLVLSGVFAVKSLFLWFVTYRQTRFAAAVQASMSQRLFALYLSQPWTFHLQRNSADLIRTINDVQAFSTVCTNVLVMITELLVMAGLGAMLLVLEPTGTLVVAGVLGAAAWAFNQVARRRSRQWGWRRRHHATMLIRHLQQALGGAKDVTVLGRTRWFLDRFRFEADGLARMTARQSLVDQSPRQWFEPLAVFALFLLAAAMVWQERPAASIVPMLGLFATVAFRLLPSINRMSGWLQALHFSDATIRGLVDELALEAPPTTPEPTGRTSLRNAVTIEHVDYVYPGGRGPALRDVSLRIPQGASVGLVGGSGSGKSTLVDVMLGLLPPTSGRVCIDGHDIRDDLRGWQDLVGYVAQSIFLTDDSIRRNVAFGLPDELIDDAAVRRALVAARLDDFVDGLPAGVDTVVGERGVRLSGGQRQRIGIARALYHDPQVLVLDEATSALDVETEREVMAAVNSLHGVKTLLIVAHRISTVADCDVLYRLDEGRVARSGTLREVTAP